ncbi:hypothetical protein KGY73_03315 [bacterium]|nr:hypothetical protein [bacterium]
MNSKRKGSKRGIIIFMGMVILGSFLFSSAAQESEVFMWIGFKQLSREDPLTLDNILRFAKRMDIIPYSSGMNHTRELERFLKECQRKGFEKTWIEIGPGKKVTAKEFVENPSSREETLSRFKALAEVYKKYYPHFARITIFDEAPLGAFGRKEGSYKKQLEQFQKYGPRAFAFMYEAIKQVMPAAQVGIFLHHPHNASPRMAGDYSYIKPFMEKTSRWEASPDFIFSDVYRGYFNRGFGVEKTDDYITDVVNYTRKISEEYGAKAYQLGQMHTIKLGYTPSQRQIDHNVEAMLRGNPHGIGWYWPNYASTNYRRISKKKIGSPEGYDVSFDPFVPNSWGKIGPAGSVYGTSKDRFVYSYLRILESLGKINFQQVFDLWVYGYDFDHVEHKLYLKDVQKENGKWELIGHFNPQQDKQGYVEGAREEYMYSYHEKWHAVAFHGLSREKFLTKENESSYQLTVKIETSKESDQSLLSALYVMPYRKTRHYALEDKITEFIERHPRWVRINSLTHRVAPQHLTLTPQGKCVWKVRQPAP